MRRTVNPVVEIQLTLCGGVTITVRLVETETSNDVLLSTQYDTIRTILDTIY